MYTGLTPCSATMSGTPSTPRTRADAGTGALATVALTDTQADALTLRLAQENENNIIALAQCLTNDHLQTCDAALTHALWGKEETANTSKDRDATALRTSKALARRCHCFYHNDTNWSHPATSVRPQRCQTTS